MRIAQVSPLAESVPPQLYGGTERVVSYLTEELVGLGHEVTLFASGDSQTKARLVPACSRALWHDETCRTALPHELRLLEQVFADVSRFDVIHFHLDFLQFPFLRRSPCVSVTTEHGRLDLPDLNDLFEDFSEMPLVSISDAQRAPFPGCNWQRTVYHGIPRDMYTFRERPEDYLAFLGRVSPEKRLDRAIEIARRAGRKLKVAARIPETDDEHYRTTIEPLLDKSQSFVEFVGQVGGKEKDEFLGNAAALLFPIDWPEPFGLVMIEAMACGTPTVAWRCGSVPEVISDGTTGFIVDSIETAVEAVNRVSSIDRRKCREVFEERFDARRMALDYLEVYRRLMQLGPGRSHAAAAAGPEHCHFAGANQARKEETAVSAGKRGGKKGVKKG